MKNSVFFLLLFTMGCQLSQQSEPISEEDWTERKATADTTTARIRGKSYLSVNSQVYSFTEHRKVGVTAMVSMRNVSETDTIYVYRADFYATGGKKLRSYFNFPIYILPMETIEIVIPHTDNEGGTGPNFVFEWQTPVNCPEPLFEGIMNYMQGTQGFAFSTRSVRIN